MALALGIAGLLLLPQPWNVVAVVTAAAIEVGEVFVWIKFLRRYRVHTGAEAMIGTQAVVQIALAPRGTVTVRGEGWNAVSENGGNLSVGQPVTIVGVDGLTLRARGNDN